MSISQAEFAQAAAHATEAVRRFDHDRYLTTLFAPADGRRRLLLLYAFNLEVARIREAISEPLMGHIRLQWWRDALAEMRAGSPPRRHPVVIGLAGLMAEIALPSEPFERLLAARELDFEEEGPADLATLEGYAEATSGSLTRLAVSALGVVDEAAAAAADDVGAAYALVGLLRAASFHARQHRNYLPRDMLAAAGIAPKEVYEGKAAQEALAPIAETIARHATDRLARARAKQMQVTKTALPALLAARLTDFHLARLARARYRLFAPELQRPAGSRAAHLAFAALVGRY